MNLRGLNIAEFNFQGAILFKPNPADASPQICISFVIVNNNPQGEHSYIMFLNLQKLIHFLSLK